MRSAVREAGTPSNAARRALAAERLARLTDRERQVLDASWRGGPIARPERNSASAPARSRCSARGSWRRPNARPCRIWSGRPRSGTGLKRRLAARLAPATYGPARTGASELRPRCRPAITALRRGRAGHAAAPSCRPGEAESARSRRLIIRRRQSLGARSAPTLPPRKEGETRHDDVRPRTGRRSARSSPVEPDRPDRAPHALVDVSVRTGAGRRGPGGTGPPPLARPPPQGECRAAAGKRAPAS